MKIKWMMTLGIAAVFAMTGIASANLLSNGDFALGSDGTTAPDTVALDWNEWNNTGGGSWNNREANVNGIGGDTSNYYKALGNGGRTDIGIWQTVPATAGFEYKASVDSGDPEGWWFANGEIRIEFMDASSIVLGSSFTHWTHLSGDTPLPWTNYSTTAIAPAGTTQIKFILENVGYDPNNEWTFGGTMRFDNAELIVNDQTSDFDSDGLPNYWEIEYGLDPLDPGSTNVHNGPLGDPDGDFLSNTNEFVKHTNPQVADTDGDGLNDGDEVNSEFTDPLDADTDDDLLTDGDEVHTYGTEPLLVDTDFDGANDATEVYAGSDPTVGTSVPANALPDVIGIESFYYNNGAFGSLTGGELFDYDNTTNSDAYTGHTGASSAWGVVWNTPYITAGRLETRDAAVIRPLNGAATGGEDIALFAQQALSPEVDAEILYAKVDMTLEDGISWGGLSLFANDVEELFFGVGDDNSGTNIIFKIEESGGGISNYSAIAATAGPIYTMVVAMDAASGTASMWVDPVLSSPEPGADIILSSIASTNLRCSAVRLASGGSGAIYWDNLVIGTTWDSLSTGDSDSDSDGLWDAWEINYGLNPLDPGSTNGPTGNPDGDGLVNSDELANGTDPTLADTDWDGLDDDVEVNSTPPAESDPLVWDTDDDGLRDGDEVNIHGTNPSLADTDSDGEDDWFELFQGTDPTNMSSTSASEGLAVVDGSLDAVYGDAIEVQTLNTLSDNLDELDAAYAFVKNDRLYLMITGNMNTNWNSLEIFIDSTDAVTTNIFSAQGRDNTAAHMNGLVFDTGFSPDYHIYARIGPWNGLSFNLDFADLGAGDVSYHDNAFSSLPEGTGYMGTGDATSNVVAIGFNNSNVAGVVYGSGPAHQPDALAVTTGFECSIALADLGNPGDEIRIMAMLTTDDHASVQSQLLPGVSPTTVLGATTNVDFSAIGGDQFFIVDVPLAVKPAIAGSRFISANTLELNVIKLVKDVDYTVQETADLMTTFTDVPGSGWTAAGTNKTVTVTVDTVANPAMFFRVVAP